MWEASWVPCMLLINLCQLCLRRTSDDPLREVWCKCVSGLCLENVLCWCRSVSTSMASLCSTNLPTSWLRQALSQLREVALQRTIEKLVELVESCFASSFCILLHTTSIDFSCVSDPQTCVCPPKSNGFMRASWHSCIGSISKTPSECTQSISSRLAANTRSSGRYPPLTSSQNFPPTFTIFDHISGTGPAVSSTGCNWSLSMSCSRSAFRIVAINFGKYVFNTGRYSPLTSTQNFPPLFKMFDHTQEGFLALGLQSPPLDAVDHFLWELFSKCLQNRRNQSWRIRVQQRSLHLRIHPVSLPNFLVMLFKVSLQGCFDSQIVCEETRCFPNIFTSFWLHLLNIHLRTSPFTKLVVDSTVNFLIVGSLHDACPPGSACSQ